MRRFLQQQGRNEKPQVWEIECKKNEVFTTWGQLGGAVQKTVQKFQGVNLGKANEKTPGQVAQEFMDRTIKKKTREGYHEVGRDNKPLVEESVSEVDLSKGLPINLRFFKPQNSMNAYMEKKLAAGQALALRKRDGMMHVVHFGPAGKITMYGSNMLTEHKDEPGIPWLDRYPTLANDLLDLAQQVPENTVLLGELVSVSKVDSLGYDIDDFVYVGSVVKSLCDRAVNLQKEKGPLGFCAWDIAYWEGKCVLQTWPATERFRTLFQLLNAEDKQGNGSWAYRYLRSPEIIQGTQEELLAFAKKHKWEGFVIVDEASTYGDRALSLHGKAERPKEVCKLKPTLEADFIVRWDPDNGIGAWGKGKKSNGVGCVLAYLWDPRTKQEVPVCEVGGGLTDEDVKRFADPSLYPMIWQVEFSEWTPKGALRFPVFLRERDDKKLHECTVDQRPVQEEE